MLGLRFCARAFPSCGKWGPLFIAVHGPLTIVASLVAEHRLQTRRLSSCGTRAQLPRGMWDLPRPGLEPVSPALAGRLPTTAPPGKPLASIIFDGEVRPHSHHCSPVCKIISLSWVFIILTMICTCMVFFVLILLGIHCAFCICGLIFFINFGKISTIVSSNISSTPFFLLFPAWIPIRCVLDCLMLSCRSWMFCLIFITFLHFLFLFEQFILTSLQAQRLSQS